MTSCRRVCLIWRWPVAQKSHEIWLIRLRTWWQAEPNKTHSTTWTKHDLCKEIYFTILNFCPKCNFRAYFCKSPFYVCWLMARDKYFFNFFFNIFLLVTTFFFFRWNVISLALLKPAWFTQEQHREVEIVIVIGCSHILYVSVKPSLTAFDPGDEGGRVAQAVAAAAMRTMACTQWSVARCVKYGHLPACLHINKWCALMGRRAVKPTVTDWAR